MTPTVPTNIPVPQVTIAPDHEALFIAINAYVHSYMSQYDNSHDYQHILRVLSNANSILKAETETTPATFYDTTALFLAALLHDVGDHKYAKPGEDVENQIRTILLDHGASPRAARTLVQVAKAYAVIGGRDFVAPDDVKAVSVAVLAHRLGAVARRGTDATRRLVTEIVESVPAPTA